MSTLTLDRPQLTGVLSDDLAIVSDKARRLESFASLSRSALEAAYNEQWGLTIAYVDQLLLDVPRDLPVDIVKTWSNFRKMAAVNKAKEEYEKLPFWKKWFVREPKLVLV